MPRLFAPGNPGKPKGAVSKKPFKLELIKQLGGDKLIQVVEAVINCAISGDVVAMKLIRDTLDGLPQQQIDLRDDRSTTASELSDQELIAIASAGSNGAAVPESGEKKSDRVH